MEETKLICTDVYIAIDLDVTEFVIREQDKDISILMTSVVRKEEMVTYHGTPYFKLEPEFNDLNFDLEFDQRPFASFYFFLESIKYKRYRKEGAITLSNCGWVSEPNSSRMVFTGANTYNGPRVTMELHFQEDKDDV